MSKERTKNGTHVTLAHGNGGRLMRELIDGIFARELGNQLDTHVDAARLPLEAPGSDWLITTDGFTSIRWNFLAGTSAVWRCMARSTTWPSPALRRAISV